MATPVTQERAERIARSHACGQCLEYSFKRVVVKPASPAQVAELDAVWVAHRICGVCGLETDMGLDDEGDIVFLG
ncbi:MAG: hypothetical protein ABIZ91_17960 [Gemmatimonadaceae bacterium]